MNPFKSVCLCFFVVIFCGNLLAQCPQDYIISLTTQDEVDNFAVLYPNCTEIVNSLDIGRNTGDSDITDLSPLNQIISITGALKIQNTKLVSLSGLDNINSIGGISILENANLTNLEGLENIAWIGGTLFIGTNDDLTDISALHNITSIEGRLNVNFNPKLISLEGLNNVTSITILCKT